MRCQLKAFIPAKADEALKPNSDFSSLSYVHHICLLPLRYNTLGCILVSVTLRVRPLYLELLLRLRHTIAHTLCIVR